MEKDLRKGDVSLLKKLDSRGVSIQTDADGNIFLAGSTVKRFNPKTKEMKNVGIFRHDENGSRSGARGYAQLCQERARERFYLPEMPVDWDKYVGELSPFPPHINNNRDLQPSQRAAWRAQVSHSAAATTVPAPGDHGLIGLLFDVNYNGDGMKISEIVEGGPFDAPRRSLSPEASSRPSTHPASNQATTIPRRSTISSERRRSCPSRILPTARRWKRWCSRSLPE